MINQIEYSRFVEPLFNKFTRDGAFLTTKGADGKVNTMTISWGSVGFFWNRPVFITVVRKTRFTYGQLKENPIFTISVPKDGTLDHALHVCGTTSGRNSDKFAACHLTAQPGIKVDCPVVGEAWKHYECKVVANVLLTKDMMTPEIAAFYGRDDLHEVFFGEIVASYVNE